VTGELAPLQVDVTLSPGAPALDSERLERLLRYAAQREQVKESEVSVWVNSDAEIADLHQRYMGIEGPTDVMSFPAADEPLREGYLGDIAVSYETATRQAEEAGHTPEREIAYLALHGLLHLLGYDDLSPEERSRMLARQDALLHGFEREYPGAWR
jgi:probable rRNA maturation factor